MRFQPSRLRGGEFVAGAGAVILLLLMFLTPWYGLSGELGRTPSALGASTSVNAWNSLSVLRWLMLLTILAGIALAVLQGTQRAPALPVTLSVIATVLGALTVLALIYRVLINVPGPDSTLDAQAGAYLGLIAAGLLTGGGFRSLRVEDPPGAMDASIPMVVLGPRA
jgi:hypothetical protein